MSEKATGPLGILGMSGRGPEMSGRRVGKGHPCQPPPSPRVSPRFVGRKEDGDADGVGGCL